jgi:UDPglucose 6-dehydrogenase
MTRIGVVGLGKLGLPVAICLALKGHEVAGFDTDPDRMTTKALSPAERGPDGRGPLSAHVDGDLALTFRSLPDLLEHSDCVLVAVETPHSAAHEGVTPLPEGRADFDYRALLGAVTQVVHHARRATEIGIISTVLPGTVRRLVLPLVDDHPLVYCPQFVAMGQVATDLFQPEFVLLGRDHTGPSVVREVLGGLSDAPLFDVSIESAELAKVVYNTFVSAKVTISNVVQQMSHETGADVGAVFDIIRSADRRLTSPAYIGPGMADGGPCHPRDNIALSWLMRRTGAGADLFSDLMRSRQAYVEWLSHRFAELSGDLPMVLLGTAYKPGTEITTGSSAQLLATLMQLQGRAVRVVATAQDLDGLEAGAAAYFLGCPDPAFVELAVEPGSVVIDPWHVVPEREGVSVHHIGAAARDGHSPPSRPC